MSKINIKLLDGLKIKWVGNVDLPHLYTSMKNWMVDMGYAKDNNLEKKYIDRVKPGDTKQLEIDWHGEKKKGEFFTYNIDVTILTLGMKKVEVQQGDIKKKMYKGTFEIRLFSYLKSTPKWDELKGLQKLYQELFIRKRIDVYLEEIYKKSTSFHSFIKGIIGLRD